MWWTKSPFRRLDQVLFISLYLLVVSEDQFQHTNIDYLWLLLSGRHHLQVRRHVLMLLSPDYVWPTSLISSVHNIFVESDRITLATIICDFF
jgi:hypothetical protein